MRIWVWYLLFALLLIAFILFGTLFFGECVDSGYSPLSCAVKKTVI